MIADPVLVDDWHPVVTCEELAGRKVAGARLLGEDIVIWQAGGQALAWQDLCVHRGTRLSLGRVDGCTLQCPYHGWVYGADGQCVRIPALPDVPPPRKARVRTYRAIERYGLIWVSLGQPAHEVPPFPEWEDAGFRKLLCGPYAVEASGPRIVENFLDIAHFPFVHEDVLGTPERPEIADYQAVINDEGVEARGGARLSARPLRHRPGRLGVLHLSRLAAAHGLSAQGIDRPAVLDPAHDHAARAGTQHGLDVDGHELRPRPAGGRPDRLVGRDLRAGSPDPGVPAAGAAAARPRGRAQRARRPHDRDVPPLAAAAGRELRHGLISAVAMSRIVGTPEP
jgi:nitrite reductase/ring-hydroxylating ferredoxin subunit